MCPMSTMTLTPLRQGVHVYEREGVCVCVFEGGEGGGQVRRQEADSTEASPPQQLSTCVGAYLGGLTPVELHWQWDRGE